MESESPRGPDRGRSRRLEARTLLAGVAVRPFAQSAARAGADVAAVDHFGDRDLRRDVPLLSIRRDTDGGGYSASALARLSRRVRAREVGYAADLENHPDAVARLARGRRLLGNPPDVLGRARDPFRVARTLEAAGVPSPRVRRPDDAPTSPGGTGGWLRKPLRSGGGGGVRPWAPGQRPGEDAYLQEWIHGTPVAVLFVADGGRARLLGVSEMLVGRGAFGASGFLYSGSLLRRGGGEGKRAAGPARGVRDVVEPLVRELGLRGLGGVDAVVRDGVPWPVEVNPRWTSSMELLEAGRRVGTPALPRALFDLHRRGCLGELPPRDDLPGRGGGDDGGAGGVVGKAVVRAREAGSAPDLERATGLPGREGVALADVPEPGDPLPAGGPVCTVLAEAGSRDACLRRLEEAAARVYRALGDGTEAGGDGAARPVTP